VGFVGSDVSEARTDSGEKAVVRRKAARVRRERGLNLGVKRVLGEENYLGK